MIACRFDEADVALLARLRRGPVPFEEIGGRQFLTFAGLLVLSIGLKPGGSGRTVFAALTPGGERVAAAVAEAERAVARFEEAVRGIAVVEVERRVS